MHLEYYEQDLFQGPLLVQPNLVDKIVLAACCLHNFLTQNTQERRKNFIDESQIDDSNGLIDIGALNRNPTQ